MGYRVARTLRSSWMPNERLHASLTKCSLLVAVSQHTAMGYCTSRHHPTPICAPTSYMVGLRHISSSLLTTILSLVSRSTFREPACLDPTTSVPCLVIFIFSEKRIGGVCSCAHYLRARKILRQQLRHGVCCAHSLASTCSCSARG
jgi:hypothetical protein